MQSIRTKNKSTSQKTITIHIITTNSPNPKKRYHNNTTQKDYHLMNTDSEYKHKTIQSYPSISNQSTIDWRNFIRGRISQVFYPQSKKILQTKKLGTSVRPQVLVQSIDYLHLDAPCRRMETLLCEDASIGNKNKNHIEKIIHQNSPQIHQIISSSLKKQTNMVWQTSAIY